MVEIPFVFYILSEKISYWNSLYWYMYYMLTLFSLMYFYIAFKKDNGPYIYDLIEMLRTIYL